MHTAPYPPICCHLHMNQSELCIVHCMLIYCRSMSEIRRYFSLVQEPEQPVSLSKGSDTAQVIINMNLS